MTATPDRDRRSPGGQPQRPWPTELRLKKSERTLIVTFDSGEVFHLPAELLRVHSPSAEVKGHGPGQEKLVWGKKDVGIAGLEPVGNYAVRIRFDDGHDTGLYSWDLLYKLGRDKDALWADYIAKLADRGLSR